MIHSSFRRLPPPVIVIGMHRSGTSLLAAMLAALGVFMGQECAPYAEGKAAEAWEERCRLNGYAESAAFRSVNDRVLARAGASWDQIGAFLSRREDPAFAFAGTGLMARATFGQLQRGYLDRLPAGFEGAWGWKDPRNSLTLDYWLRLFPEAKILHVRREREAVVDSLHQRAQLWARCPGPPLPPVQRARGWLLHPMMTLVRARRRFKRHRGEGCGADLCLGREYCRRLSDQYVAECLRFRRYGERYREVWYEEALADPLGMTGSLAAFTGTVVLPESQRRAAGIVRPQQRDLARCTPPFHSQSGTSLGSPVGRRSAA